MFGEVKRAGGAIKIGGGGGAIKVKWDGGHHGEHQRIFYHKALSRHPGKTFSSELSKSEFMSVARN